MFDASSPTGLSWTQARLRAAADRLYVDCTADGLPRPPTRPIFEGKRVTIQQVRESSPTFNAALLGHFEATLEDIDEQNRLAPPNVYQSSALDWIRARHVGMIAQRTWNQMPDLGDWLDRSRLNVAAGLLDHADEARVAQAIGSYLENTDKAIENLGAFRARMGDDPNTL